MNVDHLTSNERRTEEHFYVFLSAPMLGWYEITKWHWEQWNLVIEAEPEKHKTVRTARTVGCTIVDGKQVRR